MITLLFLLLLIAFKLAYVTSKQQRKSIQAAYLQKVTTKPTIARFTASILIIIAMAMFITKLGIASGIAACILGLMGAGSLIVLLQPLNYLRGWTLAGLFAFFFVLELFI